WLSLAAGIGIAAGVWAAAGPIAELMREPRLVSVLRPLALMVPVHALLVVPRALLQRALRFKRLAATDIGAEVVLAAVPLGLAFQLAIIPVQRIGEILSRVAFPSLSRIQGDLPRVRRAFAQMLRAPAAFVASGAVLLAVFAPALLARVYGPAWLPAVRPLQLL